MKFPLTIIGDVYGHISDYEKITEENSQTIQVGDFGFKPQHEWHVRSIDPANHKICFGNHDDANFLSYPHSLKDMGTISIGGKNIVTIRGAFSIDRHLRIEGVDWWRNEEIPMKDFYSIIAYCDELQPDVIISHDCPQIIRDKLFDIKESSLTSSGLDEVFAVCDPKLWIFGHHHRHLDEVVDGTRFICLKELETFVLSEDML